MDWTDDLIARLRELWSQGLSTAEIGRQLAITKNAVVGKAHRLGLPPRPSPIRNKNAQEENAAVPAQRKSAAPRKKKAKEPPVEKRVENESERVEKPQKPGPAKTKKVDEGQIALPLESKKVAAKKPDSVKEKVEKESRKEEKKAVSPKEKTKKAKAEPAPEIKPIVRPKRVRDIMESPLKRGPSCQWPFGDPGTPDFHFCGAKPLPGKPYCAEHAAIAYVRIRDRREG
ncbi:GcrA family cell cycle regulator [Acetobacteraceae bacterium ESL0709]|nr:GcrA family cell cycle regulator [Acetobacteraceae bacterium ESL0697]MDF7677353.1 GcrA family cell cycle regulator [Acetobacteraceae bacterium ESL0709]